MAGNIYLIQEKEKLVRMTETEYDSEDLLQELLAKYPDLLAGDQIDSSNPRRWLLVSREVEVPGEEEGPGRWSVDHVFLDQDGIPTLIEVKRSTDTRLRREVVGQMLDYAANAVVYWTVDEIRRRFESRCAAENKSPEQELGNFLSESGDAGQYWEKVKTNIHAGKIRLVFVADVIPDELRRIVEFLNEQMNSAEVLAIEIKQYVGSGLKTLVPRVYGQTAESERTKTAGVQETKKWNEDMFLQTFVSRGEQNSLEASKKILDWAKNRDLRIWWGEGLNEGSFYPMLDYQGEQYWTVSIRTGYKRGYVQVPFKEMRRRKPFDSEGKRAELVKRFNQIRGVTLPLNEIDTYPSIPLSALSGETALKQFLETLDWILQQIRDSQ